MNMDLRFDDMTVDTTLAQNYIREDEILFEIVNGGTNKSFYNGCEHIQWLPSYKELSKAIEAELRALADKLKEKADLFAQLEYLYRKIPIEDTKSQLNIIVKQIHYLSCYTDVNCNGAEVLNANGPLIFYNDSPLLVLGFVGRLLLSGKQCYIHCKTQMTAAVSHLFVKLCYEAGLRSVGVALCFDKNEIRKEIAADSHCDFIPLGANGVISEHSDINSAVDVFLTSSLHVPWRLNRILVQESVYKQFKDAITWKCNLKQQGDENSNTLEYNGRRFLIDPVESTQPLDNQVIVEAYRTTKELISLLQNYKLHYLSLWTNDIAESNEIAYSVSSPVVWVNSLGDFRGPPKVSEAIFSHILYSALPSREIRVTESDFGALVKVRQAWLKLDLETRRDILCKGLLEYSTTISNIDKDIIKQLHRNATDTFVDVGNDYVCTGISVPNQKMYATNLDYIFNAGFFLAVLHGNAFAEDGKAAKSNPLVEIFKRSGVPFVSLAAQHQLVSNNNYLAQCVLENIDEFHVLLQRIKVIWSNSGTIFAN